MNMYEIYTYNLCLYICHKYLALEVIDLLLLTCDLQYSIR